MLERARGRVRDAISIYTALSRGRGLTTVSSYKRSKWFIQCQNLLSQTLMFILVCYAVECVNLGYNRKSKINVF